MLADTAVQAGLAAALSVPAARLELAVALSSIFSAPALALLLRRPQEERATETARLGQLVLGEAGPPVRCSQ